MENKLPTRKRNRLADYDYSTCGAYFLTVCTKDRKNIFWGKNAKLFVGEDIILPNENIPLSLYGKAADDTIRDIPKHYPHIELTQYVIMPNHIHLILFISDNSGAAANRLKVLVELFQSEKLKISPWNSAMRNFRQLAGSRGRALVDRRNGRNTQDFQKSFSFRFLFFSIKKKRKNYILAKAKRRVANLHFKM